MPSTNQPSSNATAPPAEALSFDLVRALELERAHGTDQNSPQTPTTGTKAGHKPGSQKPALPTITKKGARIAPAADADDDGTPSAPGRKPPSADVAREAPAGTQTPLNMLKFIRSE